MKLWDEIQLNYVDDLKQNLGQLVQHRELISQRCLDAQMHFLQIVQRKDDKIVKKIDIT